jgi:hypothetical protein
MVSVVIGMILGSGVGVMTKTYRKTAKNRPTQRRSYTTLWDTTEIRLGRVVN